MSAVIAHSIRESARGSCRRGLKSRTDLHTPQRNRHCRSFAQASRHTPTQFRMQHNVTHPATFRRRGGVRVNPLRSSVAPPASSTLAANCQARPAADFAGVASRGLIWHFVVTSQRKIEAVFGRQPVGSSDIRFSGQISDEGDHESSRLQGIRETADSRRRRDTKAAPK